MQSSIKCEGEEWKAGELQNCPRIARSFVEVVWHAWKSLGGSQWCPTNHAAHHPPGRGNRTGSAIQTLTLKYFNHETEAWLWAPSKNIVKPHLDVSKNSGFSPKKWMVSKTHQKPYEQMPWIWGYPKPPLFLEKSSPRGCGAVSHSDQVLPWVWTPLRPCS